MGWTKTALQTFPVYVQGTFPGREQKCSKNRKYDSKNFPYFKEKMQNFHSNEFKRRAPSHTIVLPRVFVWRLR
jgi:hypothetical protein